MADETAKKRSAVGRLASMALGTAFAIGDAVEEGVTTAASVTKGALHVADQVTAPIRKPLDAIGVTDLVKAPVEAVGERLETTAIALEEKGRTSLVESTGIAAETIGSVVDAVIVYLTDNPQVDALIRAQVDKLMPVLSSHPAVDRLVRAQVARVLPALMQSPEVQDLIRAQAARYIDYLTQHPEVLEDLIRAQGDDYIDYLNAYPAAVQNLVQGQSLSLAGQVRDEVRERTVTADSVVDMVVRNLFRLRPREDLPEPVDRVQRRAEHGRLPSDYVEDRRNGSE